MAFNFSVNVYPFNSTGKAKAFASVIIEDVLEIKGFKVIEGPRGMFVGVPQREGKDKEGERTWYPDVIFHEDTNPDEGVYKGPVWQEISNAILHKYNEVASQNSRGDAARSHSKRENPTGGRPVNPMGEAPVW